MECLELFFGALHAIVFLPAALQLQHWCPLQALPRTHRISDQLRAEYVQQLLLKVPAQEIRRRCRDQLLDRYMSEHKLTNRKEALAAYCNSRPPRDWSLSLQDIANIRRDTDKATWRFHDDPQTSVKMWVAQHPDAVLYMDEQAPLPGTPDYAFMQSLRQAAAKGSWGGLSKQAAPAHGSEDESGTAAESGQETQPDEAVEPAFRGADESADRPELINLDRAEQPALVQDRSTDDDGETFNYNPLNFSPFSIAIMQPENVEAAIKFGHGRSLQLDSTFGCNAQKLWRQMIRWEKD